LSDSQLGFKPAHARDRTLERIKVGDEGVMFFAHARFMQDRRGTASEFLLAHFSRRAARYCFRLARPLRSCQTTAQAMTSQTSGQNPNQMSHLDAIGTSLQAAKGLKHRV
jgi:hypothetical protein